MFLAQSRIIELANSNPPLFSAATFDVKCTNQSSYDLRLGKEAYVVGADAPVYLSDDKPYLTISPGEFAILTCFEEVDLPRTIMGFITLRNRFKTQGLVNISGFHVDPTFKGVLNFAVNNAGPSDIRLKFKDPTFSIFFANVEGDIGKDRKEQASPLGGLPLEFVQNLGGSSVTLTKLQKEIEELRTRLLIYAPFAIAVLIALIVSLIKGH